MPEINPACANWVKGVFSRSRGSALVFVDDTHRSGSPRSDPMSRSVTPPSLQVGFLAHARTAPDQEPTATLDTHQLERRSRPRHGDARALVTGRIGFRHPTGFRSVPGPPARPREPSRLDKPEEISGARITPPPSRAGRLAVTSIASRAADSRLLIPRVTTDSRFLIP